MRRFSAALFISLVGFGSLLTWAEEIDPRSRADVVWQNYRVTRKFVGIDRPETIHFLWTRHVREHLEMSWFPDLAADWLEMLCSSTVIPGPSFLDGRDVILETLEMLWPTFRGEFPFGSRPLADAIVFTPERIKVVLERFKEDYYRTAIKPAVVGPFFGWVSDALIRQVTDPGGSLGLASLEAVAEMAGMDFVPYDPVARLIKECAADHPDPAIRDAARDLIWRRRAVSIQVMETQITPEKAKRTAAVRWMAYLSSGTLFEPSNPPQAVTRALWENHVQPALERPDRNLVDSYVSRGRISTEEGEHVQVAAVRDILAFDWVEAVFDNWNGVEDDIGAESDPILETIQLLPREVIRNGVGMWPATLTPDRIITMSLALLEFAREFGLEDKDLRVRSKEFVENLRNGIRDGGKTGATALAAVATLAEAGLISEEGLETILMDYAVERTNDGELTQTARELLRGRVKTDNESTFDALAAALGGATGSLQVLKSMATRETWLRDKGMSLRKAVPLQIEKAQEAARNAVRVRARGMKP